MDGFRLDRYIKAWGVWKKTGERERELDYILVYIHREEVIEEGKNSVYRFICVYLWVGVSVSTDERKKKKMTKKEKKKNCECALMKVADGGWYFYHSKNLHSGNIYGYIYVWSMLQYVDVI